ncbi:hemerythrin domain-containing protein [Eikenella sp. S3360]|uniref:Hemerythrin domain-containing protein n=1 Tax=Eikenella glucosivorans TaxID=2766967 RepID=A0ABS0NA64_9NEIS|nr:hemerythrin domain-containing protein [Eikenella glucosivorans]MBH5329197.1 hemerythrin domain-containing protein [Eikenella glucosivorans]
MKRHPLLVPLSQDHHHSLAMCTRILRDPAADHRADFLGHRADLLAHFAEEERLFAPWWGKLAQPAMRERFEGDHALLRGMLASPELDNPDWLKNFAETLRGHARFEERELFQALQEVLPEEAT